MHDCCLNVPFQHIADATQTQATATMDPFQLVEDGWGIKMPDVNNSKFLIDFQLS